MKLPTRLVLIMACLALFLAPIPALAGQDALNEERYRRLNDALQRLLEAQESILKRQQELEDRINALSRELARSKEDAARSNLNTVTRDDLKSVVEKLQEVDRKREADKQLLLDSIRELAKAPLALGAARPPAEPVDDTEKYKYTVKPGESLFAIMAAYNELYKEQGRGLITLDQVVKANPGINPDLIREGQVIYIPIPKKR